MPNKKGGKKHKRNKKQDDTYEKTLRLKEEGQEYAQIIKCLGNCRFNVLCFDDLCFDDLLLFSNNELKNELFSVFFIVLCLFLVLGDDFLIDLICLNLGFTIILLAIVV